MKGRVFLDGPGVQVSTIIPLATRMHEYFYTYEDGAICLDPLHLTEAKTLLCISQVTFNVGFLMR